MRPVIERLLEHPELDINAIDLKTGMTALHIACVRGDDPALVRKLLEKGAKPDIRDYSGATPLDLIDRGLSWDDAKAKIESVGGVITLPAREDRSNNQVEIRKLF